jgi:uncharacterized spore protein YtfJ
MILVRSDAIVAGRTWAAMNPTEGTAAMTASENELRERVEGEAEARQEAERAAGGPAAQLLERMAGALGGRATVGAVYGEPIERGDVTVIPVASFGFGFGGGAGVGLKAGERAQGGGGGGGATAKPIGYIEISGGTAVYKPIRDPMVDILLPLALALTGAAAPRVFRKVRDLRAARRT